MTPNLRELRTFFLCEAAGIVIGLVAFGLVSSMGWL